MRNKGLLLVFALAVLLPAGPVRAADEVILEGDPLQLRPTPERALVYVLYAGLRGIDVFLDRTPVATLNDSYVAVLADPGPRIVWGTLRGRRFDFAPGKAYVLIHAERWSVLGGHSLADQVKARRLRWAPPPAAERDALTKRLAAGEYPWALEVLGPQLPARDPASGNRVVDERSPAATGEALAASPALLARAARLADDLEAREEDRLRDDGAAVDAVAAGFLDLPAYFALDADAVVPWLRAARARAMVPLAAASVGPLAVAVGPVFNLPAGAARRPRLVEAPPERPEAETLSRAPGFAEIPGLARELEAHLAGRPDDAPARLLAVRLGRLQKAGRRIPREAPMLEWLRIETEARAGAARLRAHLEEVLKREPENASAHLCKARLESLRVPVLRESRVAWEVLDAKGALAAARRAVELAPADPRAALTLAELLSAAGKPEEALAAARQGGEAIRPIAEMLADLQAVAIPPRAVLLAAEGHRLMALLAAEGWLGRYPHLRVRVYAVPGGAEAIQKFYQRPWPSYAFLTLGETKVEGVGARLLGQHLRWKPQGLEPTGNRSVLARHEDGLALFLLELSNLPPAVAEVLPAAKAAGKTPGASLCLLTVVTFRPAPPAG